jgi:hypothetical protein
MFPKVAILSYLPIYNRRVSVSLHHSLLALLVPLVAFYFISIFYVLLMTNDIEHFSYAYLNP